MIEIYAEIFLVPQNSIIWETLAIMQILNFRFLMDLHVLRSKESENHKVKMVSANLLICQSVQTMFLKQMVIKTLNQFSIIKSYRDTRQTFNKNIFFPPTLQTSCLELSSFSPHLRETLFFIFVHSNTSSLMDDGMQGS